MDPQQVSNSQPAPESAPTPPVSDVPSSQPASAAGQEPVPAAKSVKKLLPVVAAVAALVVIVLLGTAWLMYFSPAAQSKRLSNSFMHSITTGDVAKATGLSGDNTAKGFLTTASKSVHGGYVLSKSQFKDNKGYYLYTLSGAADKYARTITEEDNGKRVVSSFVFSGTALALIPSSSSSAAAAESGVQPKATSSDAAGCLTAGDFSSFANLNMGTPTQTPNGLYEESFQLEFDPNVATYTSGGVPDPAAVFNDFKDFYTQNANKKYVIELESSVNSSAPDEQLATARDNKVQSDLENTSGIPAARISIQPITNDTSGNSASDAFYRQVQITLESAASCVSK